MTTVSFAALLGDVAQYKYNPLKIQSTVLKALSTATNGDIDIVDPTNPFVFALEASCVNTAMFMQEMEAATRRLYPSAASTEEELYLHMSDLDYEGRFSQPAPADFTIVISKDELYSNLVYDASRDMHRMVIPRNTMFHVSGVTFSIQYPIEIRLLRHGGLQIVYLNEVTSPLQSLETNQIDWVSTTAPGDVKYIMFTVPTSQFKIETIYNNVSASSGLQTTIDIDDQFYFIRCYAMQAGKWVELRTTHTQQVYDPNTPTVLIRVYEKKVVAIIPSIYVASGLLNGQIRFDVYQTKGDVSMNLEDYTLKEFSATWYNVDQKENDLFNVAIRNVRDIGVFSRTRVSGGRNSLSFKDLKARVMRNAIGNQSLPITNAQIQADILDLGYTITANIDSLTNRTFLASKKMPYSQNRDILTPMGVTMATVALSMNAIEGSTGVYTNANRTTITSKALYKNDNGVISVVTADEFSAFAVSSTAVISKKIAENDYFYSPWTYVLDASEEMFDLRPYYLDDPKVTARNFVDDNPTTGFQVGIGATYEVYKQGDEYTISIRTKSSSNYRDLTDEKVYVQMSLKSTNQEQRVYALGTTVARPLSDPGSERFFTFKLKTNFDIDKDGYITLVNLKSGGNGLPVKAFLTEVFDFLFIVGTEMPLTYQKSKMDDLIDLSLLPKGRKYFVVSHERLTIEFGIYLKNLWARARSVQSSIPLARHATDVPKRYLKDVYEVDPVTGASFTVGADGRLVYKKLHSAGDPVLDPVSNQPEYLYRVNDIVMAEQAPITLPSGEVFVPDPRPVPEEGFVRDMTRIIDVFLVEGAYYFIYDTTTYAYITESIKNLIKWITTDLQQYEAKLLEQTRIYFYPRITTGNVQVLDSKNEVVTISSSQSIKVKLYVSPMVYEDQELCSALTTNTIKVIDKAFDKQTITVSEIESMLRDSYQEDVLDVEVSGIGGAAKMAALTLVDPSARLGLRKRLVHYVDDSVSIEEDVTVTFVKHGIGI